MVYQNLTRGFWDLSQSCKWDKLEEPQHSHLIIRALGDTETSLLYNQDGTYTLYSKKDALLVFPRMLTTRLLLCFYRAVARPA